jgi:hypothetical protein
MGHAYRVPARVRQRKRPERTAKTRSPSAATSIQRVPTPLTNRWTMPSTTSTLPRTPSCTNPRFLSGAMATSSYLCWRQRHPSRGERAGHAARRATRSPTGSSGCGRRGSPAPAHLRSSPHVRIVLGVRLVGALDARGDQGAPRAHEHPLDTALRASRRYGTQAGVARGGFGRAREGHAKVKRGDASGEQCPASGWDHRGGPTGIRTRDLRIKGPEATCSTGLENGCDDAASVGDVRLVYVSQCVESESCGKLSKPPVADSRLLPPGSDEIAEQPATPRASLRPTWTDPLQAAERDYEETRRLADPSEPVASGDAVEAALANALAAAAAAGRFDVVAQLARDLEARRQARAGNIVLLDR